MFVREGIHIGPLFIHYYGIIIMSGAFLGAWLTSIQAKRRGENPETVWDFFPWIILAGVIGARLWHIFTPSNSNVEFGMTTAYYLTHPLDAIDIRKGGLGIPGAVFGGLLALWYYCRKHNISFARWIDYLAPGLAIAQAIGRWGNFVNQELYGAPTNLPWKLFIDPAYRLPGYQNVEYFHPLFLYESIYNLVNAGVLLWLSRKKDSRLLDGDVFILYALIYAIGRFGLEFLRLDASSLGGINANQTLMGLIAIGSAIALFWRHRAKGQSQITPIE